MFSTGIITERTTLQLKNHWKTQGDGSPERLHQFLHSCPPTQCIFQKKKKRNDCNELSLSVIARY